jgi:hypothetical protein
LTSSWDFSNKIKRKVGEMQTGKVRTRVLELSERGLTRAQIVEKLATDKFKTKTGSAVTRAYVNYILAKPRRKTRTVYTKTPTTPTYPREILGVTTTGYSRTSKVIAVIGEFNEVQKLVNGWMSAA